MAGHSCRDFAAERARSEQRHCGNPQCDSTGRDIAALQNDQI
jgi:hypothetical protein